MNNFEFCCPNCGMILKKDEHRYFCEKGHSFDRAKEGYVNLLLPGNKHSKIPGDNQEMVRARRSFLEKGYYSVLADALANAIKTDMPSGNFNILDAGCGEGYYTQKIYDFFPNARLLGVDISKFALKSASKKNRNIGYAVGSIFRLPILSETADIVMTLFAPFCRSEFERVLKKGGYLYRVIPDRDHLLELKQAVYDQPYENEVQNFDIEGFEFIRSISVRSFIHLSDNADIENLFQMTPYSYKTSEENTSRLHSLNSLDSTISFLILCYRRGR